MQKLSRRGWRDGTRVYVFGSGTLESRGRGGRGSESIIACAPGAVSGEKLGGHGEKTVDGDSGRRLRQCGGTRESLSGPQERYRSQMSEGAARRVRRWHRTRPRGACVPTRTRPSIRVASPTPGGLGSSIAPAPAHAVSTRFSLDERSLQPIRPCASPGDRAHFVLHFLPSPATAGCLECARTSRCRHRSFARAQGASPRRARGACANLRERGEGDERLADRGRQTLFASMRGLAYTDLRRPQSSAAPAGADDYAAPRYDTSITYPPIPDSKTEAGRCRALLARACQGAYCAQQMVHRASECRLFQHLHGYSRGRHPSVAVRTVLAHHTGL